MTSATSGLVVGLALVSQRLADHVLTGLPVVKHVAGVTAEACCPVSR